MTEKQPMKPMTRDQLSEADREQIQKQIDENLHLSQTENYRQQRLQELSGQGYQPTDPKRHARDENMPMNRKTITDNSPDPLQVEDAPNEIMRQVETATSRIQDDSKIISDLQDKIAIARMKMKNVRESGLFGRVMHKLMQSEQKLAQQISALESELYQLGETVPQDIMPEEDAVSEVIQPQDVNVILQEIDARKITVREVRQNTISDLLELLKVPGLRERAMTASLILLTSCLPYDSDYRTDVIGPPDEQTQMDPTMEADTDSSLPTADNAYLSSSSAEEALPEATVNILDDEIEISKPASPAERKAKPSHQSKDKEATTVEAGTTPADTGAATDSAPSETHSSYKISQSIQEQILTALDDEEIQKYISTEAERFGGIDAGKMVIAADILARERNGRALGTDGKFTNGQIELAIYQAAFQNIWDTGNVNLRGPNIDFEEAIGKKLKK
ncbi:MAG: hypothetical protein V1898_00175 [Patescibacteria group bacterium]